MISSAKTLLLATLVFNAATVFGAPIRNVDANSESVVRSEISTPVKPRAAIVDVEDNRRRSRLGHITRRSARLISERDEPLPEAVVVREPAPIVNDVAPIRERRYLRRALHDRHENPKKREPAVTNVPVVKVIERRYPRRILQDRYEKREPATSIKETTTVVEKVTVLDTPADALAFNSNNLGGSNPPPASSTVSTLVSISATTTLASDSTVPTSTATTTVTDSVSASSTASSASATASSASATASSAASSTTDSVSATATATSTSATDSVSATATATSTATATDSTITGSPTGTASSGDPTSTASVTSSAAGPDASPPASGDPTTGTPSAAGAGDPTNPVRRGIYIRASTEPILRRLAFSGASWASSVKRQLNSH